MQTLSLKQVRKKLGLPETPEDRSKKLLQKLSLCELKYLAQKHRIKVKGRISEDWFSETKMPPSKRQYVNALVKELNEAQIKREIGKIPKTERKKKRKKSGTWFFRRLSTCIKITKIEFEQKEFTLFSHQCSVSCC